MARMRTLKPSFFMNETLADMPPLGRLLFAGLWCLADRAGRLEDRPKRIKAEVLPYDDADVDTLLQQLHDAGFILRYACGEQRYIQVVNFTKHQSPHVREPASIIQAPGEHGAGPMQAPEAHAASTPRSGIRDLGSRNEILDPERETRAKDETSPVQAPTPAGEHFSLSDKITQAEADPDAERSADIAVFTAWCEVTHREVKMLSERRNWMGKLHELRISEGLSPPGVAPLIAQYRAKFGSEKNPSPGQVVGVYSQLIGTQANGTHPSSLGSARKAAGATQEAKVPGARRRSYADLVDGSQGGSSSA